MLVRLEDSSARGLHFFSSLRRWPGLNLPPDVVALIVTLPFPQPLPRSEENGGILIGIAPLADRLNSSRRRFSCFFFSPPRDRLVIEWKGRHSWTDRKRGLIRDFPSLFRLFHSHAQRTLMRASMVSPLRSNGRCSASFIRECKALPRQPRA